MQVALVQAKLVAGGKSNEGTNYVDVKKLRVGGWRSIYDFVIPLTHKLLIYLAAVEACLEGNTRSLAKPPTIVTTAPTTE